jgi:putative ABC transport system permease protein
VGNFSLMVVLALAAVFLTLLLVVANSQSESVHARLDEFALLRSLGFRRGVLVRVVLAETLLMCLLGGGLGALLGAAGVPLLRTHSEMLASLSFWWRDLAWAASLAGAVALLSAAGPAWRVWRAPLATYLGRTA